MQAHNRISQAFRNLATKFTADDSPASYIFVYAVAAVIVGNTVALLGYELFEMCRLALAHI